MRPLAFIAVRTTGADPDRDALVELAVLRVDPRSLEVEQAMALASEDEVRRASAFESLEPLLAGTTLAGHDLGKTLAFLRAAWAKHGHEPTDLGEHPLDTTALAWGLHAPGQEGDLSLEGVCAQLGIDDAQTENALGRAHASLEIARRLVPGQKDEARLQDLRGDERAILGQLLDRLHGGREAYGPWKTDDGRVYLREALMEVLDALHYVSAELVRLERHQHVAGIRTRRVYVCHPFRDDPVRNAERVRDLCRGLLDEGFLPVAPQLYLPQFVQEETERELALRLCLELLDDCDEVRVCGAEITDGMRREIERAEARGLKVSFDDAFDPHRDPATPTEAR